MTAQPNDPPTLKLRRAKQRSEWRRRQMTLLRWSYGGQSSAANDNNWRRSQM